MRHTIDSHDRFPIEIPSETPAEVAIRLQLLREIFTGPRIDFYIELMDMLQDNIRAAAAEGGKFPHSLAKLWQSLFNKGTELLPAISMRYELRRSVTTDTSAVANELMDLMERASDHQQEQKAKLEQRETSRSLRVVHQEPESGTKTG